MLIEWKIKTREDDEIEEKRTKSIEIGNLKRKENHLESVQWALYANEKCPIFYIGKFSSFRRLFCISRHICMSKMCPWKNQNEQQQQQNKIKPAACQPMKRFNAARKTSAQRQNCKTQSRLSILYVKLNIVSSSLIFADIDLPIASWWKCCAAVFIFRPRCDGNIWIFRRDSSSFVVRTARRRFFLHVFFELKFNWFKPR